MSTITKAPAHLSPKASRVRWPLPAPVRKVALMAHIISAGTWFGIDLALCVLVVVGWLQPDSTTRDRVWQPLATWYLAPMLYITLAAGLVCMLSGLLLGFASKYGVLRYWWVAVKLLLNVVMTVVLLLVLLNLVRDISIGRESLTELSTIFFLSAVAVGMVSLVSLISVFKPWGRIRAGQDRARH